MLSFLGGSINLDSLKSQQMMMILMMTAKELLTVRIWMAHKKCLGSRLGKTTIGKTLWERHRPRRSDNDYRVLLELKKLK